MDDISICIKLEHGKGFEQVFFDALGSNPLKVGISPLKDDWGRYVYMNVLRVNASDASASDQIASITRNAYASINETVEAYQKSLS